METICLSIPSDHYDASSRVLETVFLALLLNPDEGSSTMVTAGASKSNLFFSSVYGASAEPKFGMKHPGSRN